MYLLRILISGYFLCALSPCFAQQDSSASWTIQIDSILHYWQTEQFAKGDSTLKHIWNEMLVKDDVYQYLESVRTVAKYWRRRGEPQQALGYYEKGLPTQLWRPAQDSLEKDALGWLFVNIGFTYGETLGQNHRAQQNYIAAKKLFEGIEAENYWVARFLWAPLANLYTRLGDFAAGEQLLREYLVVANTYANGTAVASGLMDLGLLYQSWNKPADAEGAYLQALTQADLAARTRLQILANLTVLKLNQDKVTAANNFSTQASRLIDELSTQHGPDLVLSLERSVAVNNQALIAQAQGKYDAAEAYFQQAYNHLYTFYGSTQRREIGKHHVLVGQLYLEQARYRDAAIAFQEALTSVVYKYCPDHLLSLPEPTQCYAENTMLDALEGLAQTYEAWFSEDGELDLLKTALTARERMHLVGEELRKVYLYEGSQLQNLEDIRSLSEAGIALARQLAQLTGESQYRQRAFRFAERERSHLLRAAYQHEQASSSGLSDSQQRAESDWQFSVQQAEAELYHLQASGSSDSLLAAAEQAVWQARNGRHQFLQTLERENPRYYQLKYADDTPSLEALQRMLAPGQLLVEYFVGKTQLYVFTLSTDSDLELQVLPLPEKLTVRVMNWRRSIEAYQQSKVDHPALLATYRQEGYQLYQDLLAPVLAKHEAESLLLIPSGVLDLLPFEALLQQATDAQAKLRDYPYVLKEYKCSYGYSASLQYTLHQLPYAGQGLGGYSPLFDGTAGWQPLSCSGQTLAEVTWSDEKMLYYHEKANRSNFLAHAGQFAVLHLATHAQANAERGDFSFIVFSNEQGGYDSLFAQSLYHLNLPNELVVLSACETALGTLYQSEGVISLARGFHYAGVRSVLTTLWQVNEGANCRLMPTFYNQLDAGADKATALHAAKLAYLNKADERAAHPVYWAGYQMLGNARPLASPNTNWWILLGSGMVLILGLWYWRRLKPEPQLELVNKPVA